MVPQLVQPPPIITIANRTTLLITLILLPIEAGNLTILQWHTLLQPDHPAVTKHHPTSLLDHLEEQDSAIQLKCLRQRSRMVTTAPLRVETVTTAPLAELTMVNQAHTMIQVHTTTEPQTQILHEQILAIQRGDYRHQCQVDGVDIPEKAQELPTPTPVHQHLVARE